MLGTWELVGIGVIIIMVIIAGKNSSKIARKVGKNVGEIQEGLSSSSKEFIEGLKEAKNNMDEIKQEVNKPL